MESEAVCWIDYDPTCGLHGPTVVVCHKCGLYHCELSGHDCDESDRTEATNPSIGSRFDAEELEDEASTPQKREENEKDN